MGGWNSGRSGGGPTVDSAMKLDLAWMFRSGFARDGETRAGALHWTRNGKPCGSIAYTAIMAEPGAERLELSYVRGSEAKPESVRQTIRLCYTVPNYGGRRWWMRCPVLMIRAGKLYLPSRGDRFASRQAWQLSYQSQREAAADRPLDQLFRLQEKLGCKPGLGRTPTRPKGMRQETFARHMREFARLEEAAALLFAEKANRLRSHLGELE
jgi:hypothetical protein